MNEIKITSKKTQLSNSASVGVESPALSDSECLDLAKEKGLEALTQTAHTLVCQFPFNAIIPLNSSILWMETLSSSGGPYHMMRSVDNLFSTTPASFALMHFNEPEFTYGVYEYVDDLNKSLTGKIVIAKPLEYTEHKFPLCHKDLAPSRSSMFLGVLQVLIVR